MADRTDTSSSATAPIRRIDLRSDSAAAEAELRQLLRDRGQQDIPGLASSVAEIIESVARDGDRALCALTARYDGVELQPEQLEVERSEWEAALARIAPQLRADLEDAASNIARFHRLQREAIVDVVEERPGRRLSLVAQPLGLVGVYVPGGRAPLPSSVLMNVLPARAAGVETVVMCTPPQRDRRVADVILAAAAIAGVDRLFCVGGAQAIAAMALGTERIPQVDKIAGPGNLYVNEAKRQVFGRCDIDMLAGPSEILVIADGQARPDFVAADLLGQAEHDPHASAVLLSDSEALIEAVERALSEQIEASARAAIIRESLARAGALVAVRDLDQACELANQLAPEHLELLLPEARAEALLPRLRHAGSIFVGAHSPEPLGDYWSGANHVLPTGGSARFSSPLNTSMFLKYTSHIQWSEAALREDGPAIVRLAEAEGLDRHAASVARRLENGEEGQDA